MLCSLDPCTESRNDQEYREKFGTKNKTHNKLSKCMEHSPS